MYHSAATPATDTPALLRPQNSHTHLCERNSTSSAPPSTASDHHTSYPSVPNPAAVCLPKRLRGVSSIKELVRKTSHSVLNLKYRYHRSPSLNQIDLDQHNVSVIHLPGSPKGPTCHPSVPEVQSSTEFSFDSLTPDQSGISNESTGPVTPSETPATQSLAIYGRDPQSLEMGNTDSKLAGARGSKAYLRGRNGQQNVDLEDSSTPASVRERALKLLTEPNSKQAIVETSGPSRGVASEAGKGQGNEVDNTTGPPPVLRHRASSGQVQVPRRRSSLTALHLDSSHFEKLASTTPADRDNRISSFSASFDPVVSSSSSITVVTPPTVQGDKSDNAPSSQPLSPSSSQQGILSTDSSAPSPAPRKRTGIYFPKTFPDGPPEIKPAPITQKHYECFASHEKMWAEKAMFNQVPCMTCGIDDKQQRHCCNWCDLRLCDRCKRQLDSIKGRPLLPLVQFVARTMQGPVAEQSKSALEVNSGKTSKQEKGDNLLKKVKSAERGVSKAESDETMKGTGNGQPSRLPIQSKDATRNASIADQLPDHAQNGWLSASKAGPLKEATPLAEQRDQAERAEAMEPPTK